MNEKNFLQVNIRRKLYETGVCKFEKEEENRISYTNLKYSKIPKNMVQFAITFSY